MLLHPQLPRLPQEGQLVLRGAAGAPGMLLCIPIQATRVTMVAEAAMRG